jgi:tRNA threonylcarbamoyl adenosine modification protein (Sua5/YciO/YrdC/YwlC family)
MSTIDEAVKALQAGELVVVPTDTVYGVAALPGVKGAIERLFWVKGRPRERAIPVLGATLTDLQKIAVFDKRALALASEFWPGALTLVLPRAEGFDIDLGGEDHGTVAVRIPAEEVVLDLLAQTGPMAVTSANLSGEPAATTVDAARSTLGNRVNVYLDAGKAQGAGSTVVSLVGDDPECLREGDLPYDYVRRRLGQI